VRLAAIPALAYGLWRLRSSANAKGTLAAAARRCGFARWWMQPWAGTD